MSDRKQIDSLDYLRLATGVRLHWSEVRQQHWLLFPEGALALNPTAVAILSLCNSHLSFDELVTALNKQFSNVQENDIQELLSYMMQRGLLSDRA